MALTDNLWGSQHAHRMLACLIVGFILICHIFRHALMACESHIKLCRLPLQRSLRASGYGAPLPTE